MDANSLYHNVTLDITGVTQDEAINGLGDGDSRSDAVYQEGQPAGSVLLRAERSGNGNGRMYEVDFTATDGFEACTGSVRVAVPHSRNSTVVNDGQTVDSIQP
jgi:chitinase